MMWLVTAVTDCNGYPPVATDMMWLVTAVTDCNGYPPVATDMMGASSSSWTLNPNP